MRPFIAVGAAMGCRVLGMLRWLRQRRRAEAAVLAALLVTASTAACGSSSSTATGSVVGKAYLLGNVPSREFATRSPMVRIELVRDDHVVAASDIAGRGTRYRITISYRLNARAGRYTLRVGTECPKSVYLRAGARTTSNVTCLWH
jgi:hypothetical protein